MDNRCFIIGNGKSLKTKHLKALANETTFATNMISKLYDDVEWRPTYYTAVSTAIEDESYRPHVIRGIKECDTALVWEKAFYHLPTNLHHVVPLDVDRNNLFWSSQPYDKVSAWGMSHLVSFNWAVEELGVDEIYLIGFDLGYKPPTEDHDPNHFVDDYWDFKNYVEPKMKTDKMWFERAEKDHTITHEFVKEHAEDRGVRVFNCTFGGQLKVYPRRNFYSVLRGDIEEEI